MEYKWIGAGLIVVSCAVAGYIFAASYRREERELEHLIQALKFMENELRCRLTPLPELCRGAAESTGGVVRAILHKLADTLMTKAVPDVRQSMESILTTIPLGKLRSCFEMLGCSLGRFDMTGQLDDLASVREYCVRELDKLRSNREQRMRSCQTLWICAGAALAILFV